MALHTMEQEGISSVYVLNENKKVEGIITLEKAVKAKKNDDDLQPYLIKEYPKTAPETPLNELIPLASTSKFPIVVENKNGILQGIIVRVSVLSSLTKGSDTDD